MSDGDSKNKIHKARQKKASRAIQRTITDVSYVLPASWLRRPIQIDHGPDWIILGRGRRLLFYFRIILFILYFLIQAIK